MNEFRFSLVITSSTHNPHTKKRVSGELGCGGVEEKV